jgi:hypothetical protein
MPKSGPDGVGVCVEEPEQALGLVLRIGEATELSAVLAGRLRGRGRMQAAPP